MLLQSFFRIRTRYTWAIDILFLILFLGILTFFWLGSRPLFVPDEGRYAEIAREMVNNGDFITPYLNGIKYFEKPILFYWLTAAAIKIGGLNFWVIRSVNALLGLMGCLATYYTARQLFDRQTGLVAACILGTNLLYFIMSRMISLDLPVTVFMTLSLYAFILSTIAKSPTAARHLQWSAAVMAACAVLTKGLIGIIFPALIILIWLISNKKWFIIKPSHLITCLLIFIAIAAPWHLIISLKHPEFPYFYFVEQHFLRYSTKEVGHYQPIWFFIPWLMAGFFPWIIFLPQAVFKFFSWKKRHQYTYELFFLIWAVTIFIFFSFSKSKLIPYILPIFPPLAILVARYLTMDNHHRKILISYQMIAFTSVLLIAFAFIMPQLDKRTILPLAATLKPLLHQTDEVITYNVYYQDLPFYLERTVNILNWRNELSFGMQHQNSDWMINDQKFWELWDGKRIFVVISLSELKQLQIDHPQKKIYLLNKTTDTALITNREL
jgi:4-amino-4-deoxy-L-arabinose transferase-like glycosyltransferase